MGELFNIALLSLLILNIMTAPIASKPWKKKKKAVFVPVIPDVTRLRGMETQTWP